jgi:hypothetical protein
MIVIIVKRMTVDNDGVACRAAATFETAVSLVKIAAVKDARFLAGARPLRNEKRVFLFVERGPYLIDDWFVGF